MFSPQNVLYNSPNMMHISKTFSGGDTLGPPLISLFYRPQKLTSIQQSVHQSKES